MNETINILYVLGGLFLLLLVILWISLPFAVFGTKEKLDELIRETKSTNDQLEKLRSLIVMLIKLQKNSKLQKKESKADD